MHYNPINILTVNGVILFVMVKPLSITEIKKKISSGEAKDPLVFLASLMNGEDPRTVSKIYQAAKDIQEFTDGEPDKDDWESIYKIICASGEYGVVDISTSLHATKILSEYIHPKRKQIDLNGVDGSGVTNVEPLTDEEIELFKERFNDEF